MRNRILSVSMLSAGLMLGSFALPAVRAEDKPADDAKPKQDKPRGERANARAGAAFPVLDRLHDAVNELKLTDEQKEKVDKSFKNAKTEMAKLRDDAGGDRQAMTQKYRGVIDKVREEVSAVLTEEQREQLKGKIQKALQQGGAGDQGGRMKEVLAKLDLSEEQKEKVKGVMEETQKQMQELRGKGAAGGDEVREKYRTLLQESREKVSKLLTEEQQAKFKELMQAGAGERPAAGERRAKPKSEDK